MTTCGATLQYGDGLQYVCAQPAGHKDAHYGWPMTWACNPAPIATMTWTH